MKHGWIALLLLCGCSGPPPPQPKAQPAAAEKKPEPVRITQFYATAPNIVRGGKSLLCYGVENATGVRITPPVEKLSVTLSRCISVAPEKTTTYTLTAEGEGGARASQEVTVTVGAAPAHIVEVKVSALAVKPGDVVMICYQVRNAAEVRIAPMGFARKGAQSGCASDQPKKTTTYTVTAVGSGGNDQEHVTVQVR